MKVFVIVKTQDQGTNGINTEVSGVYKEEDRANSDNKFLNSQIPMDLRDKIWHNIFICDVK